MIKAFKHVCVSMVVLFGLALPVPLLGMFCCQPRAKKVKPSDKYSVKSSGMHVEGSPKQMLLPRVPSAKVKVAPARTHDGTLKRSVTTTRLQRLCSEPKQGALPKKGVTAASTKTKVLTTKTNNVQAAAKVRAATKVLPKKQEVSPKEAKPAIRVEAIEVTLADNARSVNKAEKIALDVSTPEALYRSLHVALERLYCLSLPTLDEARREAKRALVSALLLMKVDVNALCNSSRQTALHLAADDGDVFVVGVLLRAGAKVCLQDANGLTALHSAAYNGDVAVVKQLLRYAPEAVLVGADFNTAYADVYKSAYAKKLNSSDCLQIKFSFTPLHWLLYNRSLGPMVIEAVVTLLIAAVPEVVWVPDASAGKLPLHYAAEQGLVEVATIILRTAQPLAKMLNTADSSGWTALHYAASFNRGDMVELLLNAGASAQVYNKYYQTPRMLAEQSGNNELAAVLAQAEKNPKN